jgi:hypothetical protein
MVKKGRMKRRLLIILAFVVVAALAATLLFLLQTRPPTPSAAAALPEEEAVDPLRAEMECIDRVLQNRNLRSQDVQPALDACRGASSRSEANSSQ